MQVLEALFWYVLAVLTQHSWVPCLLHPVSALFQSIQPKFVVFVPPQGPSLSSWLCTEMEAAGCV